ncbi:uncharacterized protein LOC116022425 [Ipomoea triloba]|uniref:uncharacterized protein LOC116022425 n=1 Tax=Ipomoea triloba TaxID=35885 RepID=UPI00125CF874|nr:uncharacterized protein LOC116022425 [Ipomoea triloba]
MGWKFLMHPDALVSKVFKARYFPNASFLEAGVGSNPSFVWSSIRESQEIFRAGMRWKVGNGSRVRVWGDPWLTDKTNPYIITPEPDYLHGPCVNNLFCQNTKNWDYDLLRDIFCQRDVECIMSVPTSLADFDDSMYWGGEGKGIYTVKSAYRIAMEREGRAGVVGWSGVWKLNIPPKFKCFFWSLCSLRLPTKDLLCMKQVNCDQVCLLCGLANESDIHVFANCSFARSCWRLLNTTWRLAYLESVHAWVEEMWIELTSSTLEQAIMVCWSIWEARNQLCWKNSCLAPGAVVAYAQAFYDSWQSANAMLHGTGSISHDADSDAAAWQPPRNGYYKLNIDVAMDYRNRRMGFGWVCRDERGYVHAVIMERREGLYSVKEAEAMGARLSSKLMLSFVFAKRSRNMVAHTVASHALCNTEASRVEYLDSIPRFLSTVV